MKLNINNLTLTCKKQPRYCTGCHFNGRHVCLCPCYIINQVCFRYNVIFLRTNISNIFDL